MNKIHKLSEQEIVKIAAGEVLEKPANAVKELVENSIDAGATFITLELLEAGKKQIKISDNGSGMSIQDVRVCYLPHTTSKLSKVEDLETICTFGFRGEALASMCAVSLVTIITKEAQAEHGTKIIINQGVITSEEIVSAPTGTTIIVDDIFEYLPARRKFLKKDDTEWRSIVSIFHAFCLAYPHIHFKLFHNEQLAYNCTPSHDIKQRIAQIWNSTSENILASIESKKNNDVIISGVISLHPHYRYDRSHVYCFVNGRYVKNTNLLKAILKGYQGLLPAQKFPTAVVFIEMPSSLIDVNIHPKKEEILFENAYAIEKEISFAISATLTHLPKTSSEQTFTSQIQPLAQTPVQESSSSFIADPFIVQNPKPTPFFVAPNIAFSNPINNFKAPALPLEDLKTEQSNMLADDDFTIIGQFSSTYILVEKEKHLIVVDQHAAHERILYEQHKNRKEISATVQLMFPFFITLTPEEITNLEPYLPLLSQHGIQAEYFNTTTILISATLVSLKNENMQELLKSCISKINENSNQDITNVLHETLYAQIACATAVKAGEVLSQESMQHIISTLIQTSNHVTCPHGRPTHYAWLADDIKKCFKRDYTSKKIDPEYQVL